MKNVIILFSLAVFGIGADACAAKESSCDALALRLCDTSAERCADARRWVDAQGAGETSAREAACEQMLADSGALAAYVARFAAATSPRPRAVLGGYLLPEVHDALLIDLEQRLNYPSLRPIRDRFHERITAARTRRQELAAMEEVQHTEILLAQIDDQHQEIAATVEEVRADLDGWRSNRWFSRLDYLGYFSPRYAPSLLDRFRAWRAVSFLMRDLERQGAERFAGASDLRARFAKLEADAAPLFELDKELADKRAQIERLDAEHAELVDAPARLHRELYAELARAIRDHIESCPTELRFELAGDDPNLVTFFKKLDGLAAKVQYQRELAVVRVRRLIDELQQQLDKLGRKISKRRAKRARGKYQHFSDDEVRGLRNLKADKWARRHAKLDKVSERLDRFDDWDRGSFGEHVLWWDVITRGARGDDLYPVRTFHERWGGPVAPDHPHAQLDAQLGGASPDDDVSTAAAAALAVDMMRDEADDWGLDGS